MRIANRMGDSGDPWGSPSRINNFFPCTPFQRGRTILSVMSAFVHFVTFSGVLSYLMDSVMGSVFTALNAPLISRRSMAVVFLMARFRRSVCTVA